MTEPKLNYLGPIPKALTFDRAKPAWWTRVPWALLVVVALPTLIAAIYFLLIASPRYVSEAQFIVRAAGQSTPSMLGVALQGVGIAPTQSDAFAVHQYISSRDGLKELTQRYDVGAMLAPPGSDIFSRYPQAWESRSGEGLYKGFQRFVTIGYDSATGISTLRVEAFRARDAQRMTEALLAGGENLVNRLNARSAADAVADAKFAREQAQARLSDAQQKLAAFRNREQFIDPSKTASVTIEMIGDLMANVAVLKAQRAQIAAEAPSSPQLSIYDNRIASFEAQIAAERGKMAGSAGSLAAKIGDYEDLVLAREFADKELAQATASLIGAEQDARRQKLYLDRIVAPNLPDEAAEPKRLLSILTIFATCMLFYGVGWLVYAGIREHRQD